MLVAVAALPDFASTWIETLVHTPGRSAGLMHHIAVIKNTFSGGCLDMIVFIINIGGPSSAAHLCLLLVNGSYFILNGRNLRLPQSLPISSSNSSFKVQAF